jgi:hypothetical protein
MKNILSEIYSKLKDRKKIFIEVHQLLTRIGYLLTNNMEQSFSFVNSYFFIDIIQFMQYISKSDNLIEEI